MNVQEIQAHPRLPPQQLPVGELPHVTIETTTSRDTRGRTCHGIEHRRVMPLEQVKAELGCARRAPNLGRCPDATARTGELATARLAGRLAPLGSPPASHHAGEA